MGLTRRQTLKGGALALLGSGFMGRVDKVAAMQKPLSMTDALKQQAGGSSMALMLEPTPGEEGPPALDEAKWWAWWSRIKSNLDKQ